MARVAARPRWRARGAIVSLGAGAVVMGTGIVSVALLADGERLLSRLLASAAGVSAPREFARVWVWVALAAWLATAAAMLARVRRPG